MPAVRILRAWKLCPVLDRERDEVIAALPAFDARHTASAGRNARS
jgi:hypothetical protein